MLVYKFGGASIATPERMQQLLPILQQADDQLVLVVSALGKTTNALETIVNAAFSGEKEIVSQQIKLIEQIHLQYASLILRDNYLAKANAELNVLFTELQWAVDAVSTQEYDMAYDQIVCIGELLSTQILAAFLQQEGNNFEWVDARDLIKTDEVYRDANIDWKQTKTCVQERIGQLLRNGKHVITQGFIGSTSDNNSITLGREGSDYTAAILAAMLSAKSVTIWKDVEGFLNADPKEFSNTVKIEAISYHEVIEMAYYGAQVIHPKTIKPIQNAGIPLYVRCFFNKNLKGTVIQNEVNSIFYPPLIVLKKNQILLQVTTKDFSFITEKNLRILYGIFENLKIKINLIQNAAISFVACIDQNENKVKALIEALEREYNVLRNEDVCLLTVRHHTPEIISELTKNRYILLEQKTRKTLQAVLK